MAVYDVDLTKATIEDFIELGTGPVDARKTFALLDKTIEGGVKHLPMTEIPALCSALMKESESLQKEIELAVGSIMFDIDIETIAGKPVEMPTIYTIDALPGFNVGDRIESVLRKLDE